MVNLEKELHREDSKSRSKKLFWGITASVFMLFVIVVLSNFLARKTCSPEDRDVVEKVFVPTPFAEINAAINPDNIKKYLRMFTKKPHMAGTKNQKEVADTIESLWKHFGLEDVRQVPYEVMLTYPKWSEPNKISLKFPNGSVVFERLGIEPVILEEEQADPHAGNQFLAWSAPGTVTGNIVFCNRGTEEDFDELEDIGISVKGNIALIRYGKLFRGAKVSNAQKYGAIGVILYSDPQDVAKDGDDDEKVYPHSVWMPHEAVQRGFLLNSISGDPLTPLYPSKPGIYRTKTIDGLRESGDLPKIPALPIPYTTAYEILSRLCGPKVPGPWQGDLETVYRFGPNLLHNITVTVEVQATFETRTIQNVIGYIKGHEEPDKYVILGNHFDAWVYGSLDPNSGTSIMTELARAMMQVVNETGWRPARTILFANWDSEEFGLIGSTEFVEEYTQHLMDRAIVYLNMDCLSGNLTLDVDTIPSLYDVTMKAAKRVENPNGNEKKLGRATVFDTWMHYARDEAHPERPSMSFPGGNTDHSPFLHYLTVPTISFQFWNPDTRNPLYHTMYETPYVNEQLMDRHNFSTHRATAQIWAQYAFRFADARIIPINATRTALALFQDYIPNLEKQLNELENSKFLNDTFVQLIFLKKATLDFMSRSMDFHREAENSGKPTLINDHLMKLERCFFNARGLPGRPDNRHVLYSIDPKNRYYARVFGPIYDLISKFSNSTSTSEYAEIDRELAEQLSMVQHAIHCARSLLRNFI
ncbi:unnamed protein product, partial [Mesorhabditis belari]|uniref:Uncharacterized protein n=1 Tax=Mesorhabditis belari TaxID=2138241 RepID=A0AAF3F388_9BILA